MAVRAPYRRRFGNRKPSLQHQREPLAPLPLPGCRCDDCDAARNDAHGAKVGSILGIEDRGACPCGRVRGADGRCCAWWQCQYAQAERNAAEGG